MFFLLTLFVIFLALVLAAGLERVSSKSTLFNAGASLGTLLFTKIVNPLTAPVVVWFGSRLGDPPAPLSGKGWHFPVSVLILVAVTDLISYGYHRLQHKVPWLWRMHSFHHSDATMNATTSYRQFWLEGPIQSLLFAPVGLIFYPAKKVFVVWLLIELVFPAFIHLNLRIGFKPAWLLTSPQFHRVHHSIEKEHYDRNFAVFFPLWDLIFGTYLQPEGFPPTGLDEGEPKGVKDAVLWAFREH